MLIFKTGTVINSFMNTEKSVVTIKPLLVERDGVITLFWEISRGGE